MLSDYEYYQVHDTLLEADGKVRTLDEVKEVFSILPDCIRSEAETWGIDTLVRDSIYEWFLKRK